MNATTLGTVTQPPPLLDNGRASFLLGMLGKIPAWAWRDYVRTAVDRGELSAAAVMELFDAYVGAVMELFDAYVGAE
jgi:hypothetical protein